MAAGGWSIRLFDPNNYRKGLDIISNFQNFKARQRDEIVVFSGMFGLESYMVWYIQKDLKGYNFNTVNLELKLFLDMDKNKMFWQEIYRVIDVKYDPKESRYVVFCLSEDSVILNTKLADYNIRSLNFDKNLKAKDVLKQILEDNNLLAVTFFESPNKEVIDYEYRQISIDPNWTIRDFISYICDDNDYEWLVKERVLYVGRELQTIKDMVVSAEYLEERDQISESGFFKKVSGDLRPMDTLAHWDKRWRCIWAKHSVGASGGVSKGCFAKIGYGTVDKNMYLYTLDGYFERSMASYLFSKSPRNSHFIKMGNIIKDEGDKQYVDFISVQKDLDIYHIKSPKDTVFDRGTEDEQSKIVNQKERVARSSPYLDHEAGLLFPSVGLDNPPPNSLIFNVEGREESPVLGPFVFGNGLKLTIPFKNKKDFRLQFPNGWCFYVEENGTTYLQVKNVDSQQEPDADMLNDKYVWLKLGAKPAEEDIEMNSPEIIRLKAVNDIDLESEQTITLDGKTYIYIGPDANSVLIAGGGKKLSHADHTHPLSTGTDGLFKMPLIGVDSAHPAAQGTTKTEAD